jgi:hypothetical protein
MTERHTITAEGLDEWLRRPQWQTFARSCSDVSNKALEIDAASPSGPVFRVVDHGVTLFIGMDRVAAIDTYNAAR